MAEDSRIAREKGRQQSPSPQPPACPGLSGDLTLTSPDAVTLQAGADPPHTSSPPPSLLANLQLASDPSMSRGISADRVWGKKASTSKALQGLPFIGLEDGAAWAERWARGPGAFSLSLFLSVSLSPFVSLSLCLCLPVSLCLSFSLCVSVSVSLSLCLYLPLSLFLCLCVHVSVSLSFRLSVSLLSPSPHPMLLAGISRGGEEVLPPFFLVASDLQS